LLAWRLRHREEYSRPKNQEKLNKKGRNIEFRPSFFCGYQAG